MNKDSAIQTSNAGSHSDAVGENHFPRSWRLRLADCLMAAGERLLAEPQEASAAASAKPTQGDLMHEPIEGAKTPASGMPNTTSE